MLRYRSEVEAEQLELGKRLPPGVEQTDGGLRLNRPGLSPQPVENGDWIVYHDNGDAEVMTAAYFARYFAPAPPIRSIEVRVEGILAEEIAAIVGRDIMNRVGVKGRSS